MRVEAHLSLALSFGGVANVTFFVLTACEAPALYYSCSLMSSRNCGISPQKNQAFRRSGLRGVVLLIRCHELLCPEETKQQPGGF